MKNVAKSGMDMTIGAAVALILVSALRQNGVEVDSQLEIAIGVVVVTALARLGVWLKGKGETDA